jgi:hypothetical protein
VSANAEAHGASKGRRVFDDEGTASCDGSCSLVILNLDYLYELLIYIIFVD